MTSKSANADWRDGALSRSKFLEDGRETFVYPLTFGRARLGIGQAGSQLIDDGW